jgi:hypothetical protein
VLHVRNCTLVEQGTRKTYQLAGNNSFFVTPLMIRAIDSTSAYKATATAAIKTKDELNNCAVHPSQLTTRDENQPYLTGRVAAASCRNRKAARDADDGWLWLG